MTPVVPLNIGIFEQREIASVKTVVRPRPLSSYMMDDEGTGLVSPPEGPPPAELLARKQSTETGAATLAEVNCFLLLLLILYGILNVARAFSQLLLGINFALPQRKLKIVHTAPF